MRYSRGTVWAVMLGCAACQPASDTKGATPAAVAARESRAAVSSATGSLDIASWNIEWFGDAGNGPSNESQQEQNARDVIVGADAEIWGVAEIVDEAQWSRLKSDLPAYDGVLASARAVTGRGNAYSATEQKVGILFKRSVASMLRAKLILQQYDRDFAGRPPLEVTLRVTMNGVTEELVCIVVHMKARQDEESWTRRASASRALKRYLDDTYPTQRVMVMGDWNDDVTRSITIGKPSPYRDFVDDSQHYRFVTKTLDERGVSSTVGNRSMVDHHLVTNELAADEQPNSARVLNSFPTIRDFRRSTSDHYPVVSRYTVSGDARQ